MGGDQDAPTFEPNTPKESGNAGPYFGFLLRLHRSREEQRTHARPLCSLFELVFINSLILRNIPVARQCIDARYLELGHEFILEIATHARVAAWASDHDSFERTRGISRIVPFTDNWSRRSRTTTEGQNDKDNS